IVLRGLDAGWKWEERQRRWPLFERDRRRFGADFVIDSLIGVKLVDPQATLVDRRISYHAWWKQIRQVAAIDLFGQIGRVPGWLGEFEIVVHGVRRAGDLQRLRAHAHG